MAEMISRYLRATCLRETYAYRYFLCSFCASFLTCTLLLRENVYFYPAVETLLSKTSVIYLPITSMSPSKQDRYTQVKARCDEKDGQQVILLTYGRSGSSLTAEIVKQQKEVFFFYEPLHNLAKLYEPFQEDYKEVTQKYLHLTSIPEYNRKAMDILEKLMTCNYQNLPRVVYLNLHMRLYDSADMFWCIKRAKTTEMQEECLKEGEKKCKGKSIRLLKIIRLSTKSVGQLMDKLPCLKMIYLVRDPRGNFLSKKGAFSSVTSNTTYEAERYCRRVNKDIDHALRLLEKYPDRVYLTRYEKIAERPLETSRKLYSFLNLTFTKSVAEYVYNNTQAGLGDRSVYTVTRGNSSEVSLAWRSRIKFEDAVAFDKECSEVYYKLGYLPVKTEKDLRNINISLKFEKSYFT